MLQEKASGKAKTGTCPCYLPANKQTYPLTAGLAPGLAKRYSLAHNLADSMPPRSQHLFMGLRLFALLLACAACDARMLSTLNLEIATIQPQRCAILLAKGQQDLEQGSFRTAFPILEQALACAEAAQEEADIDLAPYLEAHAEALLVQDKAALARDLFARALSLRQRTFELEAPELVRSLTGLGEAERLLGQLNAAERYFFDGLRILKNPATPASLQDLITRRRLARLYVTQGKLWQAEELCLEALDIAKRHGFDDAPEAALVLSNLGNNYKLRRDFERATRLLLEAKARLTAQKGEGHIYVTIPLINYADVLQCTGNCEAALPIFQQVLAIRKEALGEESASVAVALAFLGTAQAACSDVESSEQALSKAKALAERLPIAEGISSKILTAKLIAHSRSGNFEEYYNNLTEFKKLPEAVATEKHSMFITESALWLNAFGIRESSMDALAQDAVHAMRIFFAGQNYVTALADKEMNAAATCAHISGYLARFFARESTNESRHALWSLMSACQGISLKLAQVTSRRAWLDHTSAEPTQAALRLLLRRRIAQQTLVEEAPEGLPFDELDRLEKDLLAAGLKQNREDDWLSHKALERVLASIPSDTAIIDFFQILEDEVQSITEIPKPMQRTYGVFIGRSFGRVDYVNLGPVHLVDAAAAEVHAAIMDRSHLSLRSFQVFYQKTIGKLRPHLQGVKRIIVIADGVLTAIPMGVMHDGSQFLDQTFIISYAQSVTELLSWSTAEPHKGIVALVDPALSLPHPHREATSPVKLSRTGQRLLRSFIAADVQPLFGARKEARTLQMLFPDATVWQGQRASVRQLLGLRGPGVLHIAAHSRSLDSDNERSAPSVDSRGFEQRPAQLHIDSQLNALLLLANDEPIQHIPATEGSKLKGVVTALELAALNLWGTQLVVLATCESGIGHTRMGQGAASLSRAVRAAGAETVVASMFRVDDGATAELMAHFYRRLKAGMDRAQALHAATWAIRKRHPHPYYWSSFILTGNPRPLAGI